jgi:hypothetical protein
MLRPFPIILSALLFFTAAQARAEISWQANWTPGSLAKVVGPRSVIDFTNLHNASYETPSGTQVRTPVSNLWIITTATEAHPDGFLDKEYSMRLRIKDDRSGLTHVFKFTGELSGVISMGTSLIKNVFGPNATQSFTFADGDKYTVKLDGYKAPNTSHGYPVEGHLSAQITVTGPGSSPPPSSGSAHLVEAAIEQPHGTPEPSTLVLGGLGLAFSGALAWRKRTRLNSVAIDLSNSRAGCGPAHGPRSALPPL